MTPPDSIVIDRRRFLTLAAASTGLLLGCRDRGSHAPDDVSGLPPRVVGLRSLGGDFRFDPEGILLEPGSELHWLNMGDFHTTTAFHPDHDDLLPGGVPLRIPPSAEPWHSGPLGLTAGTRFTHRFEVEGVHDYFCQPHYSFGMVGRVVVGGPRGGPAVTTPLPETPPEVRRTMPSVEAITGADGVTYEWTARINGVLFRMADGEDPAALAGTVADRMAAHGSLRGLVGDGWDRLAEPLSAFREAARMGRGYEEVLQRADGVKEVLRGIGRDP